MLNVRRIKLTQIELIELYYLKNRRRTKETGKEKQARKNGLQTRGATKRTKWISTLGRSAWSGRRAWQETTGYIEFLSDVPSLPNDWYEYLWLRQPTYLPPVFKLCKRMEQIARRVLGAPYLPSHKLNHGVEVAARERGKMILQWDAIYGRVVLNARN